MSIALDYGSPRPELLAGTIDLHIHSAPDIFPRSVSAITAAQQAKANGMRAIVVKSHSTDTAARAETARELVDFPVYGGVVLNYAVGGLNEYAVLETARQGGRIVWMPTITSRHFIENSAGAPMLAAAIPPGVPGLTATEDGRLLPEASAVIDAVAASGLTLATGHLTPEESLVVGRAALERGVRRVIVTHPHVPFVGMPERTAAELAALGAYIEVTDHEPLDARIAMIRTVGVEHCFLSTDGGTLEAPEPVIRLSSFLAALSGAGFSQAELSHLSRAVPAYLLGLDGDEPPRL